MVVLLINNNIDRIIRFNVKRYIWCDINDMIFREFGIPELIDFKAPA